MDHLPASWRLGGAAVTGIDADPAILFAAHARAKTAGVKVTLVEGQIERLPFPDASFDVVLAMTVLCFIADAASAVREIARVLRPGDRLVLGVLGRWSVWAMSRRLRAWFGTATWKAARFRTAGELRALVRQTGLSVWTVRGAVFYPPIGLCAKVPEPVEGLLGSLSAFRAAFIAPSASSSGDSR